MTVELAGIIFHHYEFLANYLRLNENIIENRQQKKTRKKLKIDYTNKVYIVYLEPQD